MIDCGIDIGSTNVKAVLIGADGRVLYSKAIPSPRVHDGVDKATDALALVATLENLIIEGWKQVGQGVPLRSITTAGIGEDGVGVRNDLTPTGLAVPWNDRRAQAESDELQKYAHLYGRTANPIDATRTAAKWLWLHRHRARESADAQHWITLTDFPAAWWSGNPFISISLAPRTSCYDIYQRQWISSMLQDVHAPALPPVLGAGQIVGGVRGGPLRESAAASSETVVAAGGHDHPVAASAIRRFIPDARVDSLGTANLIYGETKVMAHLPPESLLALSLPPTGTAGLACLGTVEISEELKSIHKSPDDLRRLLAHQRMPGAPHATQANDVTILRSCLERASMKTRRMMQDMDQLGVPKAAIYATGGWSRSRALVELRASVFGEVVNVIGDLELTAVGAALCGTEAAGAKPACPFQQKDIIAVDPLAEWTQKYQTLQFP